MDVGRVLRAVDAMAEVHRQRQSLFAVPSAVHTGKTIYVQRLDTNPREVSRGDLHLLMTLDIAPGEAKIVRSYTGVPPNKFRALLPAPRPEADPPRG